MEYGNIVWGGTYNSDIVKLERIHVDASRLITGATARSNIAKLHEESKLRSIKDRTTTATLSMMYRIINGLSPQYLEDILVSYRNHPIVYG